MKRLFNIVKEKLEKRKNNKKKYGVKRPLFALSKKKRMKKMEVKEQYNLALKEYYNLRDIIEENIENYKIGKVAIDKCFGPSEILDDLLREQESYINILNESQEKLSSVVREKLEKWSWINRKKMLKSECFQLWIIKKTKKQNNSSVQTDTAVSASKICLDNVLDNEKKVDLPSSTDKRVRYNISPFDLQNLQFVDRQAFSGQKRKYSLVNPGLLKDKHNKHKMIVRFSGNDKRLGNYSGIAGILFDDKPLSTSDNIVEESNLEYNSLPSIDDKYSECTEEVRGAMLDYLTRVNNLDKQYNILEFENIKNDVTRYYSEQVSELEEKYMINEYRNEYENIEKNYSSYPRFVSILKRTLREKYEKYYNISLNDYYQKLQNLNEEFRIEINSLNDNYSISQYMDNKYNLEKDLSNYRTLLEEAYGKEMVDSAWNELSIELNEKLSSKHIAVLVDDNRSYKK